MLAAGDTVPVVPSDEAMVAERDVRPMALVSLIFMVLTPAVLWRSAGEPPATVWSIALLLSAYLFFWIVCLSRTMGLWIAFVHTTYGIWVALLASHQVSPNSGVTVVFLSTVFSAGVFGYALAEHRQAIGAEQSATKIKPPRDPIKHEEAIAYFSFMCAMVSLVPGARLASFIFFPPDHNAFLIIWDLAFGVCCFLFGWILLVTQLLLKETLFNIETAKLLVFYTLFYVLCGLLICLIFGIAVAGCFVWFGALAVGAMLGYGIAVYHCYKEMATRDKENIIPHEKDE